MRRREAIEKKKASALAAADARKKAKDAELLQQQREEDAAAALALEAEDAARKAMPETPPNWEFDEEQRFAEGCVRARKATRARKARARPRAYVCVWGGQPQRAAPRRAATCRSAPRNAPLPLPLQVRRCSHAVRGGERHAACRAERVGLAEGRPRGRRAAHHLGVGRDARPPFFASPRAAAAPVFAARRARRRDARDGPLFDGSRRATRLAAFAALAAADVPPREPQADAPRRRRAKLRVLGERL